MNNHLLLSALRARYGVFLFVFGLTVLVTTTVSLILPKSYIATATVLVDNKADQSMSASGDSYVRERIGYMQTQVDIITNPKVAKKVIDDLGLMTSLDSRANFKAVFEGKDAIEERLAETLLKRIKVDTSQSSVITIAFPSENPEFSARIANGFAKAYMDTALELRVEPSRQTAAWFDDQIKTLRAELEQALTRLTVFQKEKGVISSEERLEVDSIVIGNQMPLRQGVEAGGAAGVGSAADRSAQPVAVARLSAAEQRERAVIADAQRARAELAQAEAKLQEMDSRLGINHPAYQRQLALIQNLRVEASKAADTSAWIRQRREAESREAARAQQLQETQQLQQARVTALRQYRNQASVLIRDVEISQKAYETALQRSLDKKVESRASLSNVSLLNAAAVPFKAAFPRIELNVALSALVGALLGLCVIYVMELLDRRVRTVIDLENEWNVPLLAELRPSHAIQYRLSDGADPVQILPSPG